MRAWQDSYQGEVAGALGLKRISGRAEAPPVHCRCKGRRRIRRMDPGCRPLFVNAMRLSTDELNDFIGLQAILRGVSRNWWDHARRF